MYLPFAHLKLMFAMAVPVLLIIISALGGGASGDGYKMFASALVFVGAIFAAGVPRTRNNKLLTFCIYIVVLETVVVLLP